jgi:uncharacterized protein (DUF1697 family)
VATHIVLLRGINIGPNNRIPMPALRSALEEQGFTRVRTYVASGNVLVDSGEPPDTVARQVHELIARVFGFDIPVVVRSRDELAAVVATNPFKDSGCPDKLYQVSFLDRPADASRLAELRALATDGEELAAVGREWYAIFPAGIARSKLATRMVDRKSGLVATARNWRTVCMLLEMADA